MNLDLERDVFPHIRGGGAVARALLAHSRNLLGTSGGRSGFHYLDEATGKDKRVRGLTVVLDERCWAVPGAPPPPRAPRSAAAAQRARPRTGIEAVTGTQRGTIVHQQVRDFLWLDATAFARLHGAQGAHSWVARFHDTLLAMGWLPLACEFIVYDPTLRVGTAIDFVAVTRSGRLVFVELKTGYAGAAWTHSSGPMRGILGAAGMHDTPANRAMVQVTLGALLAVKGHDVDGRFECWVVRINDEGQEMLQVRRHFIETMGPCIIDEWLAAAA